MLGNKGSKKHYRSGGTRGGQDQFKWDDVKVDKYRENYLGNSVSAPVGRWQNGKDLTWYAKSSGSDLARAQLEEERRRARELDSQLIDEAMGIKPKKTRYIEGQPESHELKQMLSKGSVEREEGDVERVKGLGLAPAKTHEHIVRESSIEKEIRRLQRGPDAVEGSSSADSWKTKLLAVTEQENAPVTGSNGIRNGDDQSGQASSGDESDNKSHHKEKSHKKKQKKEKEHKHKHKKEKSHKKEKKHKSETRKEDVND